MISILEKTSIKVTDGKVSIEDNNGQIKTNIRKRFEKVEIVKSEFTLATESKIEKLYHEFLFQNIQSIHFFDNCSCWVKLEGETVIDSFHFLHLELIDTNGNYIYIYNHKPFTVKLQIREERFYLTIIHDAPFLHVTWDYSEGQRKSTAQPIFKKNTSFEAEYVVHFSGKIKLRSFIPSFYPGKCNACFILTDHCDFDTIEKLSLFLSGNDNDGWLNKGLKITKGVFRYGPKEGDIRKSGDLEMKPYKDLIDKLYLDGSEICPHALKHSGQLTSEEFKSGIQFLFEEYSPKTWIDHGSYLKYCYSQQGAFNPAYNLIKTLTKFNYNNIWSFHDISLDPTLSLNFFSCKKYTILNGVKIILKHFVKGKFKFVAHYTRSFVHKNFGKSIVVDFLNFSFANSKILFNSKGFNFLLLKSFFSRMLKFNSYRSRGNEPFSMKELNLFTPPFFTTNYQSINNWKDELLFFNTIETTHTKDVYNHKALDSLISEKGLHIGHTYILNSLPYIDGIFNLSNGNISLSNEWISFTSYLSSKIKLNQIWNPTMGEFVQRMKQVLQLEYYIDIDKIKVINNGNCKIDMFKVSGVGGKEIVLNIDAKTTIEHNTI